MKKEIEYSSVEVFVIAVLCLLLGIIIGVVN